MKKRKQNYENVVFTKNEETKTELKGFITPDIMSNFIYNFPKSRFISLLLLLLRVLGAVIYHLDILVCSYHDDIVNENPPP